MESGGYDDPVCSGEVCKRQPTAKEQTIEQNAEKDEAVRNNPVEANEEADGYEIPVKSDIVLTFSILSNSPIETVLFRVCNALQIMALVSSQMYLYKVSFCLIVF